MRTETKTWNRNGHIIEIRSAEKEDAHILLPYLKRVCGETRFLLRERDECREFTLEQEEAFIRNHTESDRACLLLAFYDGEYAGNASFKPAGCSRRNAHRADLGIALYQEYTGKGIGTLLLTELMDAVETCGFETVELTVVSENKRAIHLYEKFGFIECGRIPNA
ncbi:MAG: GNAT family N-acetyltransferase, partial [Erysipelotrichaceae bacterium]|nr:GNAT family N-acetyltransferase [Erysipelotrichaceae bacterium]